mmetsp:Transcript_15493/g.62364  ORF Transcript_15493/g.62364 Transcript_15493/m.62364 type:complete len:295 (+) Transcript_15493:277-1161(+)
MITPHPQAMTPRVHRQDERAARSRAVPRAARRCRRRSQRDAAPVLVQRRRDGPARVDGGRQDQGGRGADVARVAARVLRRLGAAARVHRGVDARVGAASRHRARLRRADAVAARRIAARDALGGAPRQAGALHGRPRPQALRAARVGLASVDAAGGGARGRRPRRGGARRVLGHRRARRRRVEVLRLDDPRQGHPCYSSLHVWLGGRQDALPRRRRLAFNRRPRLGRPRDLLRRLRDAPRARQPALSLGRYRRHRPERRRPRRLIIHSRRRRPTVPGRPVLRRPDILLHILLLR